MFATICSLLMAGTALAAWSEPAAGAAAAVTGSPPAGGSVAVPTPGSWSARASDNICGLSDVRMVSNPAVVSWDELIDETPEMKKLEREGIDPSTPQGIQLRNAARNRVTKACRAVQLQHGFCSVWRAIRHSEGQKPTDVTRKVLAKL